MQNVHRAHREPSSRRRALRLALLSATLLLAGTPSDATLGAALVDTGFEPPDFLVGSIAGQDGWQALPGGGGEVQETRAATGAQALRISRTPGVAQIEGAFRLIDADAAGRVVVASGSVYLPSTASQSFWTALDVQFGDGTNPLADGFVDLNVAENGEIQIFDGADRATGVTITRDRWNRVALVLDVATRSVSAYYNGALLYEGGPFHGSSDRLALVAVYGQGFASDSASFDDLSVGLHPASVQVGFEPPTYSLGSIDGQQGWVVLPNGDGQVSVVDTVPGTGAQSLAALRGTGSGLCGAYTFPSAPAVDGGVLRVRTSAYLSSGGSPSYWTVLNVTFGDGTDPTGDGHIDVNVDEAGEIQVFGGSEPHATGVTVTRGRWNRFEQVLDLASRTASVFYNGSVVYSSPFPGSSSQLGFVAHYGQGFADDTAFFDDLSVTVVPEPGGTAAMAAALAALWMLRRPARSRRPRRGVS